MAKKKRGLMGFKTYKERGEWVEMLFMAAASFRQCRILKPWGESFPYDVGIEVLGNLLRVQVKSTVYRSGGGYLCEFKHHHSGAPNRRYRTGQIDLFASYIIPKKIWYLIPAHRIAGLKGKATLILAQHSNCRIPPKYEHYREAWHLLAKSRDELLAL